MKFKLKEPPVAKVKYSKGEIVLFKALGEKARSSTVLVEKIYGKTGAPFNGRKIIIGALKSLRHKMVVNKEPFKILNTDRSGPYAMEFWVEAK